MYNVNIIINKKVILLIHLQLTLLIELGSSLKMKLIKIIECVLALTILMIQIHGTDIHSIIIKKHIVVTTLMLTLYSIEEVKKEMIDICEKYGSIDYMCYDYDKELLNFNIYE